ncbi:MAG: CYTH domain-containing protein [Clostridiaceae bacterium]|nr:CYTH domain-containing protein [Clostridiaceae bacterium]
MEIEKKFRVKRLPERLGQYRKKEIEQGYLCDDPVVRIRRSNDRYLLTYKSTFGIECQNSDTRVNQEVEVPLSREGYLHLREKTDHYLIYKTRYLIPLPDGHTGELDVFHDRLEGLVFVEVEFENETQAEQFEPPEWFGDNVSKDKRFTNSFLSRCDNLDALEKMQA